MPKRAIALLVFLTIIATLLVGINIGKKLNLSQGSRLAGQTASSPSPFISPTLTPAVATSLQEGISLYRDVNCGYEFKYQGSYKQYTNDGYNSIQISDPEGSLPDLVATCQAEIPKPPLAPEKIAAIVLDGVPTNLYHDASQKDGSPRDEIIVKHPLKNLEIIIAGFGEYFNEATNSFKFIR